MSQLFLEPADGFKIKRRKIKFISNYRLFAVLSFAYRAVSCCEGADLPISLQAVSSTYWTDTHTCTHTVCTHWDQNPNNKITLRRLFNDAIGSHQDSHLVKPFMSRCSMTNADPPVSSSMTFTGFGTLMVSVFKRASKLAISPSNIRFALIKK